MRKQNKNLKQKVKRIRRAIGRLRTPPPQIIENKRDKLIKKAQEQEVENSFNDIS